MGELEETTVRLLPVRPIKIALIPIVRGMLQRSIAYAFDVDTGGDWWRVRALREEYGLESDMPAMRAVGYRQAWQQLEGDLDLDAVRGRHRRDAAARQEQSRGCVRWRT